MKNGLFTILGGIFAVFVALPFAAEEANAQTACDGKATFDVFTPSSGTHADTSAEFGSYTLTGSLTEIYNSWSGTTFLRTFVQLQTASGSRINELDAGTPDGSSPPTFGGDAPMAGQLIAFFDSSQPSTNNISLRIYTRNSDSMLALTQEPATAADTCDTGLTGMQFFLTGDYAETTTAATTNIGYAAPMCIGNQTNPSGLMCVDPICVAPQIVVEGVCSDPADCVSPQVVIEGVCSDPPEMSETPSATRTATVAATSESDRSKYLVGGGLVFAGGLLFAIITKANGDEAEFTFSPDFGYSLTESGYSVNAGGRMDFARDNWRLYWTAGQTNANGDFGDFRYSSGGEYKADFWKAAFSESVQGETVDYDLSLSANWTGGIWKVSPAFAIDSVYEKGEFQTTNSFRISGELLVDDWHFSASGNKTQMQLSAVREF